MEQIVNASLPGVASNQMFSSSGTDRPASGVVPAAWVSALPTLPDPEALRPEAVPHRDPLNLALWLQGARPGGIENGFRGVAMVNQLRRQEVTAVSESLKVRLERLNVTGGHPPDNEFWCRVGLVDQFVDHICATPSLSARGRSWFRRLDSTLLLYLLLAPECLLARTHPLRQSLDALGYLGVGDRGDGTGWCEHVEWRIDSLSQGRSGFRELCDTAAFLHECQATCESRYERNVRRVMAAAEGGNKLTQAQHKVDKAITRRMPSGVTPPLVADLLSAGWRDLLALGILRNGELDQGYLALANALMSATQGRVLDDLQLQRFRRLLDQGFAVIGEGGVPAELGDRIEQCLRQGVDPQQQEAGSENGAGPGGQDLAGGNDALPDTNSQMADWEQGVQRFAVGSWLFCTSGCPVEGPVKLIWTNTDRNRFVFVTAQGRKACELSRTELASRLTHKQWIADPAWHDGSMLGHGMMQLVQGLYSQIAPEVLKGAGRAQPGLRQETPITLDNAQPLLQSRRLVPLHGKVRMGSREEAVFTIADDSGRLRNVAELTGQPPGDEWWRHRGILAGLQEQLRRCDVGFSVPMGIGIPVPGKALVRSRVLESIVDRLSDSNVPMEHLWFDVRGVSESEVSAVAGFIREVRGLGCRVCLSHPWPAETLPQLLRRLPADMIRLDGRMADNEHGRWVLEATASLAHLFGCEVMAEHVDDRACLAVLPELGIDYAQGDAVGRPKLLR